MSAEERDPVELAFYLELGPDFIEKSLHVPLDLATSKAIITEAGRRLKIRNPSNHDERLLDADCNELNYRCDDILEKLYEITQTLEVFATLSSLLDEALSRTSKDSEQSALIKERLSFLYGEIISEDEFIANQVDDLTVHPDYPANFYQSQYAKPDHGQVPSGLLYGPGKNWVSCPPSYGSLILWKQPERTD